MDNDQKNSQHFDSKPNKVREDFPIVLKCYLVDWLRYYNFGIYCNKKKAGKERLIQIEQSYLPGRSTAMNLKVTRIRQIAFIFLLLLLLLLVFI